MPFIVASAYDRPELVGGEALAGVHNIGKPLDEHRSWRPCVRLSGPEPGPRATPRGSPWVIHRRLVLRRRQDLLRLRLRQHKLLIIELGYLPFEPNSGHLFSSSSPAATSAAVC
ncbi:hypothetical protein QFZ27_001581 [Inquilinus ginsengisoli]|uniref:hypothetical protein n=1 Tax=Inquilinus ginsengisoli TaxID=363840 RepID=UPI003D1CF911